MLLLFTVDVAGASRGGAEASSSSSSSSFRPSAVAALCGSKGGGGRGGAVVEAVSGVSAEGSAEEFLLLSPAVFTGADDVDDVIDVDDDDAASLDASSWRCNSAMRSSKAAYQYTHVMVGIVTMTSALKLLPVNLMSPTISSAIYVPCSAEFLPSMKLSTRTRQIPQVRRIESMWLRAHRGDGGSIPHLAILLLLRRRRPLDRHPWRPLEYRDWQELTLLMVVYQQAAHHLLALINP